MSRWCLLVCLLLGCPSSDRGAEEAADAGTTVERRDASDSAGSWRDTAVGTDNRDAQDSLPLAKDSAAAVGDSVYRDGGGADQFPKASSFTSTLAIPGYTVSFHPTVIMGTNQGTYDGNVHLKDVIGVVAAEGASGLVPMAVLMFDRYRVGGPGQCQFSPANMVFENKTTCAAMAFSTPAIANTDDQSPVAFEATGGTVTITQWGTKLGERLSGTFNATLTGTRVTGSNPAGTPIEQTLSGTATGAFDVEIVPDPSAP